LKIVFFTFYYSPDLSAGSFRAGALAQALSKKMNINDQLHIITTHPNRYASYKVEAKNMEIDGNITIHRIFVPVHQGGMLTQARSFYTYASSAYRLSKQLSPNFIIGTTSRLMTGLLAGISANNVGCDYFIDLRDILSESLSELFSKKNKFLGYISKIIFSFLEKLLFNNASGVNVVSEGFPSYFQKKGIDTSNWSFFPNGVDQEFIKIARTKGKKLIKVKKILYAGNIGRAQGVETILPKVAKKLGKNYNLLVIGDGRMKVALEERVEFENITNIEIMSPVSRDKLVAFYQDADILFLHLNDMPSLRRSLPSKIFEYAASGKYIVAGLSGYSANFLNNNIPYASVFNPGDVDKCVHLIKKIETIRLDKDKTDIFVKKYSREKIMKKLSSHILALV
tara:strand:+ start:55 stop:1242 length:1188 start_codon:yes stop_codon:yes gene_type:complete